MTDQTNQRGHVDDLSAGVVAPFLGLPRPADMSPLSNVADLSAARAALEAANSPWSGRSSLAEVARSMGASGFANVAPAIADALKPHVLSLAGIADATSGLPTSLLTGGLVTSPRPPRPAGGERRRRRSAALQAAGGARTKEEFGAALNQLRTSAELSLRTVVDRLDTTAYPLQKSTISRNCAGQTLFAKQEHVVAFVSACGAAHEADEWVRIWTEVRATDSGPAAVNVELAADGEADELVAEFTVQITRRHVWTAVSVLAAAGVVAAAGSTSPRSVVGAALAVAGALVLLEHGQVMLPRQRAAS